jgi:omega-6 fatty acid desaturase (delta-12 desaturase)
MLPAQAPPPLRAHPAAPSQVGPASVEPYATPRVALSLLDLATSVLPYLALWVLMYLALGVSPLLALALAVPAAGFLLRTYIVFH